MSDDLRRIAALESRLDDARRSDRKAGERIARAAAIEYRTERGTIIVTVGATPESGGRTVRFLLDATAPSWSCTCTSTETSWCKHVVAAVVAAQHPESLR
ncbi:hypothetical protein [Demequina sp. NBRC 110056]|uniref:hypothetical protein n=1 Tax=Demequina sp. NBRC 110056 TaxID=1570345 RepID=UPI000A012779|nr:hypothetical protein [Demequina sp. NBRC 110056]